jgi:hypothetical protein
MKRLIQLLLAVTICVTPLLAQEKAEEKKVEMDAAQMMPPEALSDEWSKWMVGEWEGWSESAMGKSKDWFKCEFGLDGQFLMMQVSGTMENGMTYEGMGAQTINQTGEVVGYWIDNWRGMYEGKGKPEGNKLTIVWESPMGKAERTMEKISDDKFTVIEKFSMPNGQIMESKSEMTRKAMMSEKK